MFKNLSIKAKLLSNTIPQMSIILFLAIFLMVSELSTLKEAKAVYYDQLKALSEMMVTADRDFYQAQMALDKVHIGVSEGDDTSVQDSIDDYLENAQQVKDGLEDIEALMKKDSYLLNKYRANGQSESVQVIIDRIEADIMNWEAAYNPSTGAGEYEDSYPAFSIARSGINDLEDVVDAYAKYQDEHLASQIKRKAIITLIIIIILIVIVAYFVYRIITYIRESVGLVADSISNLSQGRFVRVNKFEENQDEIGHMIRDTNHLIDELSNIIGHIKSAVSDVNQSSGDLAETSSQIAQTAEGVSQAVAGISDGANQQADEIENANENVHRISNAVASVMSNTVSLDETTESMSNESKDAAGELEKLSKSAIDMSERINEITDRISATSAAVDNINEKVELITSIAAQTNLLSLNAAIEAARAGDAGRGFAVVADEISKLADDSAKSAAEIQEEMNVLLAESQSAVKTADEVKKTNIAQQEVIKNTVDSIQVLISAIETTVGGVKSIDGSAKESADAKDIVVDVMASLSAISEENAASTEETSAAMEELNATVVMLAQSAESLKDIAAQLANDIAFFQ